MPHHMCANDITHLQGALILGRGTCGTFESFQLTYRAHTTFIEMYHVCLVCAHTIELYKYERTNVPCSSERT